MEYRSIQGVQFNFAADETKAMKFSGYGSTFGVVDSYGDVIEPGAFSKSLATHKEAGTAPLMLLNHDARGSLPIGVWTSLAEDGHGLKLEGELLDTQAGRDTYTALKAGAITGLSIGFIPTEAPKLRQNPEDPRRKFSAVNLLEISVVTFPANPSARVSEVKSMEDIEDYERHLVERGFSPEEARAFIEALETKYNQAVALSAAQTLLSKLKQE